MSIFDLQEHWEANRELLPELEPALVTHTGKFLIVKSFYSIYLFGFHNIFCFMCRFG